jgi:hypothetical protein
MQRTIQERNVLMVYVYSILTLGIYNIYWWISTKRDINSLGGDIPTAWICLIPFAGLYYGYKYCEGFATKVKKDDSTFMYFALWCLFAIVMPGIVQSELNKHARKLPPPANRTVKIAA